MALSYPRSIVMINQTSLHQFHMRLYAAQLILQLGKGLELVKLDLKQAYRQVSIHPQDHHLFGISWEGNVFVDGITIRTKVSTQEFYHGVRCDCVGLP